MYDQPMVLSGVKWAAKTHFTHSIASGTMANRLFARSTVIVDEESIMSDKFRKKKEKKDSRRSMVKIKKKSGKIEGERIMEQF